MKNKKTIWIMTAILAATLAAPTWAMGQDRLMADVPASIKALEVDTEAGDEAMSLDGEVDPNAIDKANVTCTVKGTKTVEVSWKKVEGAKSYEVYRYDAKADQYKAISTTKKTKIQNKKLKAGKKYSYKVKAVSASKTKTSSISDTKTVKTPKKLTWKTKGFKKTNAYKLMKVAKSKVGSAYVYGASGPNAFDCSGFVYYVAKKAGVSVTGKSFYRGSAADERNQLKKYSIGRNIKKAQPGDILFISHSGSKNAISHVAFYYGNGKIIHASTPKTGVVISKMWYSSKQIVDIIRLPNM